MAAMDSASPPSPATPSSAPGAVVSAADFAQHEHDRGGDAASTSPATADGVMAGATVSPADKAVHRLQLLRGVRQTGISNNGAYLSIETAYAPALLYLVQQMSIAATRDSSLPWFSGHGCTWGSEA